MQLEAYLALHDVTYAEFARRIKVANAGTARRYAKSMRMPRPHIMSRIVDATDGHVQANDFLSACSGAQAAAA